MQLAYFIIGLVKFSSESINERVTLLHLMPAIVILLSLLLTHFIILIPIHLQTLPAESTLIHQHSRIVQLILVRCSKSKVPPVFVSLHVYYQFLLTPPFAMHQIVCYLCASPSDVLQMQEDAGICRKCYNEQGESAARERSCRTELYPSLDEIDDDIFLGNEAAGRSQTILQMHAITAICVCGDHLLTPFLDNPKYSYKIYPIGDFPKQQISPYFQDSFNWIEAMRQQERRILIHCAGGVSRSASFAIAYIMRQKGLSLQQAHQHIRSIRRCIRPNEGFMQQLRELQSSIGKT